MDKVLAMEKFKGKNLNKTALFNRVSIKGRLVKKRMYHTKHASGNKYQPKLLGSMFISFLVEVKQ